MIMACREWESKLALLATSDLSDDERAIVEAHLADCASCRGLMVEFSVVSQKLRGLSDSPIADADLDEVVRRSIRRVRQQSRLPSRMLASAVCALVLFSIGIAALMADDSLNSNGQRSAPNSAATPLAQPTEVATYQVIPEPIDQARHKPDRVIAKLLTRDPRITIILLASD